METDGHAKGIHPFVLDRGREECEFLSVAKEAFMGVTVRQKENGKGKPWWVFIKVKVG